MVKAKIAESVTPVENQVLNVTNEDTRTRLKRDAASKLKGFIEEERKKVKGRFRCFESPGSRQRIMVKKYKELPLFDMWMTDGEVYEIPLFVARHLNGVDVTAGGIDGKLGTCSYPVHGFKWNSGDPMPTSALGTGPDGQSGIPVPIIGINKRVRRYGFESLEFDTGIS